MKESAKQSKNLHMKFTEHGVCVWGNINEWRHNIGKSGLCLYMHCKTHGFLKRKAERILRARSAIRLDSIFRLVIFCSMLMIFYETSGPVFQPNFCLKCCRWKRPNFLVCCYNRITKESTEMWLESSLHFGHQQERMQKFFPHFSLLLVAPTLFPCVCFSMLLMLLVSSAQK